MKSPERQFRLSFALPALVVIPSVYHLCNPAGIAFGAGYEMASIARHLAAHGVFGNPFDPYLTGPTAAVPPLYPVILALVFKAFGVSAWAAILIIAANIVANGAIAGLLPRLSGVLFADRVPGLIGAALWLSACRLMPNWDASFTMLGLMLFCLVSARLFHGNRMLVSGAASGTIAGLLFLMNPSSVLVVAPCAFYFLFVKNVEWKDAVRCIAAMGAVFMLLTLPWVARNYRIWGAITFRTNFGMTLYSSNNDCAQPSLVMERRSRCYDDAHPSMSEREAALLRAVGEVEHDRLRTQDALRWIRNHRGQFLWLTVRRVAEFWFPFPTEPRFFTYGTWLITALAIPGAVLMALRRERAVYLVLAVSLLYPLMYYVVVSDVRYRFPILWLTLLPAGYGISAMVAALRTRRPLQ